MVTMQQWVQRLDSDTHEFAGVLASGDLEAAVPSCPGWCLADLADHVGCIYQWAAHAIRERTPDAQVQSAPHDRSSLVQWYRDHAGQLLHLLSSTPADAPAWGFGPKPRMVSFWARRQAHETDMHLWDARASQGQSHSFNSDRALDGIDEVLTVFVPRQVRLRRMPPFTETLALEAEVVSEQTAPHRFILHGDGTGSYAGQPAAAVYGPPDALLLLLWKRIGLADARIRVTGDGQVAEAVLNQRLTP
jgi:uncharacterized protein (TIGR03083 family)